jgi:hypothetical protein
MQGVDPMSICTHDNALWMEPSVVAADVSNDRKARLMRVFELTGDRLPKVEEATLLHYYHYLSARLSFPFIAHYPHPTNAREQSEFRCQVLKLLDPTNHFGDVFDGLFCKTRKGKYELKLPLIEVELPQDHPNCQLIEDYWFWFWNWR